jgi:hypothetical protein
MPHAEDYSYRDTDQLYSRASDASVPGTPQHKGNL